MLNLGALKDAALEQYNFSSNLAMSASVRDLMNQEGVFSLSSRGDLVVVNPPRRRDNCIYRFFKGLFNSQYKEQQRQLDKLPFLQRNASFNAALRESLARRMDARSNAEIQTDAAAAPKKEELMSSMLTDLFKRKDNKVTTQDLRLVTSAIKTATASPASA